MVEGEGKVRTTKPHSSGTAKAGVVCITRRSRVQIPPPQRCAVVVQLVERRLAKAKVASSSLVYRSGTEGLPWFYGIWYTTVHPELIGILEQYQALLCGNSNPAPLWCRVGFFVPRARIELATQGFSVLCSTTELPRLVAHLIATFRGPYRARTGHLFHAMEALYQMS